MSGDLDAWRRAGRVHQKTGQTQKSQRWVVAHKEEGGSASGVRQFRTAGGPARRTMDKARFVPCQQHSSSTLHVWLVGNSWTASADVVRVVWMQQ